MMLTPVCQDLLRKLQDAPEFSAAPDSLLVPPCPPGMARECELSEWVQPARFLRMFLEDSDAASVLLVYQTELPYVAYESGGLVYGIDHEGPHRTTKKKTMYREAISPEELFVGAPEGRAFGLWDAFGAHIEAAMRSLCNKQGT